MTDFDVHLSVLRLRQRGSALLHGASCGGRRPVVRGAPAPSARFLLVAMVKFTVAGRGLDGCWEVAWWTSCQRDSRAVGRSGSFERHKPAGLVPVADGQQVGLQGVRVAGGPVPLEGIS